MQADGSADQKLQSKLNDAWLQIERLHNSWLKCNMAIRTGDFKTWKWELDILWLELYSDVMRLKDEPGEIDWSKENMKLKSNIINAFTTKIPEKMYNALFERHEMLKHLQYAAGKSGAYYDAGAQDFE